MDIDAALELQTVRLFAPTLTSCKQYNLGAQHAPPYAAGMAAYRTNMDKIDRTILQHLQHNARASWQTVGRAVHLSGQAVAARVHSMLERGEISGFGVRQDQLPRHFITIFMRSPEFGALEIYLRQREGVLAAYKVAGEGCFHVEFASTDTAELERLLVDLQSYGNCKVLSALRRL